MVFWSGANFVSAVLEVIELAERLQLPVRAFWKAVCFLEFT